MALNLMNDIVTGQKSVREARDYYAKEFLDARRKRPTPYMESLRFAPAPGRTADLDERPVRPGSRAGGQRRLAVLAPRPRGQLSGSALRMDMSLSAVIGDLMR